MSAGSSLPIPCSEPVATGRPPYPNRQRERTQNPRSVRSSRTGGTVSGVTSAQGYDPDHESEPLVFAFRGGLRVGERDASMPSW